MDIGPEQRVADLWMKMWELLVGCDDKAWDLDEKHVKAHRT